MNDYVSLRLLLSLIGAADGIAGLDENGKLDDSVLPASAIGAFVGSYDTLAALQTAYPTAQSGQYGLIGGVKYYWNAALTPPAWNSEEIGITAYKALTAAEQAGQDWLIIPDAA